MKTSKHLPRFAFVNKEINTADKVSIPKDSVGIIRSETSNNATIFFIRSWSEIIVNKSDYKIFNVKKVGDAFPKKICNICHKLISTRLFAKNQNGINNRSVRRPSCADCRKDLEGVNISSKTKAEWAMKKPFMVPFVCPICEKRTIAGVTSKVVLDHNHRNGQARGWVCDSCNTGIGRFKDDIELVRRAIKFIE